MTRTSARGNKATGKAQGFVFLDALLCLFISGVMLLLLQGTAAVQKRITTKTAVHTQKIIEERNVAAVEMIEHITGGIYEKQ